MISIPNTTTEEATQGDVVVETPAAVAAAKVVFDFISPTSVLDEKKEEDNDEFLTETEFALLSHVTTMVGNFDPLSKESIESRSNFIPILEARGGTDKDEQGHRRDSIPIATAIDEHVSESKTQTAVFQFLEENAGLSTHSVMTNDALKKYLKRVANGIIVRINPGTLSPASQKRCDEMLRELGSFGVVILSHPDVATSLGAKDVSIFFYVFVRLCHI